MKVLCGNCQRQHEHAGCSHTPPSGWFFLEGPEGRTYLCSHECLVEFSERLFTRRDKPADEKETVQLQAGTGLIERISRVDEARSDLHLVSQATQEEIARGDAVHVPGTNLWIVPRRCGVIRNIGL